MTDHNDLSVPDTAEFIEPGALRPYPGIEVSASWRRSARDLRQMYVSLCQEGFSEGQAWDLVRTTVRAAAERGLGS
jgi:hypothetical protein